MAAQTFTYKKISELPAVSTASDTDVLVINANGVTSKISYATLKSLISSSITTDIEAIKTRLSTVESATSSLATTVSDNTTTINNIITAGFNLIGIE